MGKSSDSDRDFSDHADSLEFGNNRGNKYSKKSIHHSPTDIAFWDFSMDEFAFYDIPNSIAYILETTSTPSLSYVGFSQGTAQAFATLAVHPRLNDKVNVFIALAPAMSPAGLSNGIVDALVKASPQVLFLMFGRYSIFSSTTMWQSILYPPIFVRLIDMGLSFLFGWHAQNMSASQKLAAYPHLFSFSSVKSVVHWFQIIRTKSFQMYDDDVLPALSLSSVSKHTKVAKFPTRNIKSPIVLVYGGCDSLVDINVMLRELPSHTLAIEVLHYEHLDFLWGREVNTLVFPHVFDALESFCDAEHSKAEYERYKSARRASMALARRPMQHMRHLSEEGDSPLTYANIAAAMTNSESDVPAAHQNGNGVGHEAGLDVALPIANMRKRAYIQHDMADDSSEGGGSPSRNPPLRSIPGDEEPGDAQGKGRGMRSSSIGSNLSFSGRAGDKQRGISLGVARAVSAVSKGDVEVSKSSDEGSPGAKRKAKSRR